MHRRGGVRFDFSACQDSVWDELAKERTELEAKIKERESSCAELQPRRQSLTKKTGEVKKIYGPAKTSSTTVKVTFSK